MLIHKGGSIPRRRQDKMGSVSEALQAMRETAHLTHGTHHQTNGPTFYRCKSRRVGVREGEKVNANQCVRTTRISLGSAFHLLYFLRSPRLRVFHCVFTSTLITVKHLLCQPWDTPKCSDIAPCAPGFRDSLDAVLEEAGAPLSSTLRVALNSRREQSPSLNLFHM